MGWRYFFLLLLTGAAGVLSSLLWLIPNGLMGGVLGACLSLGTIWLGRVQTRQKGQLTIRQVLVAGAGAGLLAGVLMTVIYCWALDYDGGMFGPPQQPLWLPLVMGVLYGIGMHWGYYRRRFSQRPVQDSLIRLGMICFLIRAVGVVVGLFFSGEIPWDSLEVVKISLLFSLLTSLLGALPFALLWTGVTIWFDPAWSSPNWRDGGSPTAQPAASPAPE